MPEYATFAEKLCGIWLARAGQRLGPPAEAGHSAHFVPRAVVPALLPDPGARAMVTRWLAAT